jgi:Predicted transcriptional regulators containing the CopG/Arc/MetJ DNA-binding domain
MGFYLLKPEVISFYAVICLKLVTVKMPELYVKAIDELVKEEKFSNRSEVIRIAVRELLKRELWGETLLEEAPSLKADELVEA